MNQDTGHLQPGITFRPDNSNFIAGNDINLLYQNTHHTVTVNNPESSILTRLKLGLNPVPSAVYDSYEAKQRSECFPNTRVQVLRDIETWIQSQAHQAPIYVLDGVAGIGKSTVAQSIAIRAASLGLLGASFFFSRDEDPRKVARFFFPTIAYQLACYDSQFATVINRSLDQNPDAPAKQLYQQLFLLIIEPLRDVLLQRTKPTLIVMDALDECEEENAEELLSLLAQYVSQLKGFRILITTRPEAHLRDVLDQDRSHQMIRLHEIEDSVVHSDIRLYIQSRLSVEEIRKVSGNRRSPWQPTSKDMEILCGICGTLFIVAATVTKFILDRKRMNPETQLARLLEGVSTSDFTGFKHNDVLDKTYVHIILSAQPDVDSSDEKWFRDLNNVLGALIILPTPLPCNALGSLLGMDPDDIEAILSHLHSLVAPTGSRESMIFRIHHKSFPDFITNRERIEQVLKSWKSSLPAGLGSLLWVDMFGQHVQLAKACLQIMDRHLRWNMANISEKDWYRDKDDLPHVNPQLISRDLAYAVLHWASHLQSAQALGKDPELRVCLDKWASRHLLTWMEVMVILDQVNGIYNILQAAVESMKCTGDIEWAERAKVQELISDACKFVQQGHQVIKLSPMHIYRSCLPFTPLESSLYQTYRTMAMLEIGLGATKIYQWSPSLATFKFMGQYQPVFSVAFSVDDTRIASGCRDQEIRLWDAKTGAHIFSLTGHSDEVHSVAFSSDGSRLASGSYDKTVRLWNAKTGVCISTLTGHSFWVNSVAFSSDGALVASGSSDNTIRLWDAETGEHISTLTRHVDWVTSVAFLGSGSHLVSGSYDNTIQLWDVKKGTHISSLIGHSNWIYSVAFSNVCSLLASGSDDKTVRIWDAKTAACVFILTGHLDRVNSVAFSPNGSRLASGSCDKTIRLWDSKVGLHMYTFTGHSSWVNSIAFSGNGALLVSGSYDKTIQLWDAKTNAKVLTRPSHSDSVHSVAFSGNGSRLASGSRNGIIQLWDTITRACISTKTGHTDSVHSVAFSSNGARLASGSRDGIVRLWDASTGACISTLAGHSFWVNAVAFSSDDSLLASGSSDSTIRLWDGKTGEHLSTLTNRSDWVTSVAFSNDGSRLAGGFSGSTIKIWIVRARTRVLTLTGHSDWVVSVAFSSDDSRLASGSMDKTIRLWDAKSGAQISTLAGYSDWARSAEFDNNAVWFGDAKTGPQIFTFTTSLNLIITSIAFLRHDSRMIDHAFPRKDRPARYKITDSVYFLLLVKREEPPITGLMMANLPSRLGDGLKSEFFPVCWFPPDMQPTSLAINHATSQVAVGCKSSRVMLFDFSHKFSRHDPPPLIHIPE